MKPEPSIFDQVLEADPEADDIALAEAEADIRAGRVVPHAEVADWLKSWGTAEEAPPPAPWLKSSGRGARSAISKSSAPTSASSILWRRNAWR